MGNALIVRAATILMDILASLYLVIVWLLTLLENVSIVLIHILQTLRASAKIPFAWIKLSISVFSAVSSIDTTIFLLDVLFSTPIV